MFASFVVYFLALSFSYLFLRFTVHLSRSEKWSSKLILRSDSENHFLLKNYGECAATAPNHQNQLRKLWRNPAADAGSDFRRDKCNLVSIIQITNNRRQHLFACNRFYLMWPGWEIDSEVIWIPEWFHTKVKRKFKLNSTQINENSKKSQTKQTTSTVQNRITKPHRINYHGACVLPLLLASCISELSTSKHHNENEFDSDYSRCVSVEMKSGFCRSTVCF